jgi:hypothetical protein
MGRLCALPHLGLPVRYEEATGNHSLHRVAQIASIAEMLRALIAILMSDFYQLGDKIYIVTKGLLCHSLAKARATA